MLKQLQNLNDKKTAGSKGAISVLVALSVLSIVLTISLSASFVTSNELLISNDASDSVKSYYAAEAGMEKAIYERFKGGAGNGIQPTAAVCNASFTAWETIDDLKYCLIITQSVPLDYTTINKIQAVGEYNLVRRSMELSF